LAAQRCSLIVNSKRGWEMTESESAEEVVAKQGEKTIILTVGFFTNKLAGKGKILPRHCSANGAIQVRRNKAHDISPRKNGQPFHSLLEIGPAIEKILKEHGIVLHPSREMSYLSGMEQKKAKSAAAGGK
jgi:hypothetical protein